MMSNSPLFSVLVANFNNGCYLQKAVDSIVGQSYDNWEIIIVDDCSTDNSYEIYKHFSDNSRIYIFKNDCNHGSGYTKHRCVELSHGSICGFVDPDDLLADPDALRIMVQVHQDHPEASMVYSGYYFTDENLVVRGECRGTPLQGKTALESCSWPFKHFVSFKKEKYDLTSGIDPFMKRAVDYDMYYKLEEVGETIYLDKLLYYYRENPHSISLNSGESKARAWHSYSCVEAMKRRGLTEERLMLFPIEDALRREFNKGADHTKSTKTYQVGEAVLRPLKWIRRLLGFSCIV